MLRDECVGFESSWPAGDGDAQRESHGTSYREIDRQLRRIAKRRAALDADEACWLREAEAQCIWRKLGFATALEYIEDVYGYSPRTALERLRVARELGRLSETEGALRDGELNYAAVRELTRVMTPETEQAWLAVAHGKNARDIAEMVSGCKKGDSPDEAKQPELEERAVTFRLSLAIEALLRQTRADLSDECGTHLDDNAVIEIMCRRAALTNIDTKGADVSDADTAVVESGEGRVDSETPARQSEALAHFVSRADVPRPAYRISIRKCDACSRATVLGGGNWVPIDGAMLAMAECDAELLGDEQRLGKSREHGGTRVSPTIPKKIREHVWLRDSGRCRVPGCRATRNCDIHHVQFRSRGGDHDPSNLIVLCSGHHKLLHEGLLTITGRAPDELAFVRDGKPLVDSRTPAAAAVIAALPSSAAVGIRQVATPAAAAKRYAGVVVISEAKAALRKLGYKPRATKQALDRVCARVGGSADAATLVKAVLAMDRARPDAHVLVADEQDRLRLARQAIVQSGFDAATARRAVDAAAARVDADADLATLLREAFRWCGSK